MLTNNTTALYGRPFFDRCLLIWNQLLKVLDIHQTHWVTTEVIYATLWLNHHQYIPFLCHEFCHEFLYVIFVCYVEYFSDCMLLFLHFLPGHSCKSYSPCTLPPHDSNGNQTITIWRHVIYVLNECRVTRIKWNVVFVRAKCIWNACLWWIRMAAFISIGTPMYGFAQCVQGIFSPSMVLKKMMSF